MKQTIFSLFLLGLMCTFNQTSAHSAKAFGMGDTGVAYPQDALSSYYNPANTAAVGDRIDVAEGVFYSPYAAKITGNSTPGGNTKAYGRRTWFPAAGFGINKQLCDNIAVGFTVTGRIFIKDHYNKASTLAGTSQLGHGYELYAASGVLAYQWCNHYLGLSLDFLVGRHKAIGVQKFDTALLSVAPGHVTNRGYNWSYGLGVTLGWLWEVTDTFNVGVSFRPQVSMTRYRKYRGFIPQRGTIHSPQQLDFGVSWRAFPCLTLNVDTHYIWINRIRAAHNPLALNPLANRLGSKHGSGFGRKNFFWLFTGLDYAWSDSLVLRTGYMWFRNSLPKSQTFFNVIFTFPSIEHVVTAGATYQWSCNTDLTLFYLHGFRKHRHGDIIGYEGGGKISYHRQFDLLGVGFGYQW